MNRRASQLRPRDRHAILNPSHPGRPRLLRPKRVTVVGGGIAGLAAAAVLAEHGVSVHLVEAESSLGGRVRAWSLDGDRSMSRGFHAFFRQYYNLRSLLARADPGLDRLVPVTDYPLVGRDGLRDSFARIPRTPPLSLAGFVLTSPSFPLHGLADVDLTTAFELIDVDFPDSYRRYDGESAEQFLDRLRFPVGARHLALEVFARSFFAHPADFSAGELVAMFHTYFTGSAEGLLFDVPDDDYDTALWSPLSEYLAEAGVRIETDTAVTALRPRDSAGRWRAETTSGTLESDALVLAADPRSTRTLLAGLEDSVDTDALGHAPGSPAAGTETRERWLSSVTSQRNAPPFAVLRLWLQDEVDRSRPAFLGTTGYALLDNISILERFEAGAERWRHTHGGSVVELHAYALGTAHRGGARAMIESEDVDREAVTRQLLADLHAVYPETADIAITAQELLIADDCALADTRPHDDRPGVTTAFPGLVLAGDSIRCEAPVALMERAATTGFMAANELLAGWRVEGTEIWSPPRRGLLRRGLLGALRRSGATGPRRGAGTGR
ncbi:FAD-dependent oxidoreductase [Brevibacterium spongiae]|uniref:FAD-dependent oxidoreductase n=1 Tax=Brevibacterium spongiae TaxID=2909672 RepID=A0ABY5SLB8_9MICO|nr:FAD-dependent oxidoreductase [Brevibacterium spongiae]UVI35325.1 FAD-dependent oxidoreductase [Brevibacterium spongiae]